MASRATRRSAAASSEVLPEQAPIFPQRRGRESVTLSAARFNLMSDLADAGVRLAARNTRERALTEAVSSRRIAASAVPEWRARYNEDPRGVAEELSALAAGAVPAAATSLSGAGASSTGGPSRITSDPGSGTMTYRGHPVRMTPGGEPCVFASGDWMTVAAFEQSNLTDDALREGHVMAGMAAAGARRFREGPR